MTNLLRTRQEPVGTFHPSLGTELQAHSCLRRPGEIQVRCGLLLLDQQLQRESVAAEKIVNFAHAFRLEKINRVFLYNPNTLLGYFKQLLLELRSFIFHGRCILKILQLVLVGLCGAVRYENGRTVSICTDFSRERSQTPLLVIDILLSCLECVLQT